MEKLIKRICELSSFEKIPVALPLPVKYDGMNFYWGKGGEMVADFDEGVNTGDGFRIRGWGRIQYLKEENKTPEQLQEECAFYIERAINGYAEIQLHHVLEAIEKFFSDAGIFTKDPYLETFNSVLEQWEYNKPLSGQSYKVIELIRSIFQV